MRERDSYSENRVSLSLQRRKKMDFVISDLRGFFIHAFKISSPGQFFYFSDDEALGEIDTLCGIWEFIEKIPIEKKIVQLASNECQRRAYRIWRARGLVCRAGAGVCRHGQQSDCDLDTLLWTRDARWDGELHGDPGG